MMGLDLGLEHQVGFSRIRTMGRGMCCGIIILLKAEDVSGTRALGGHHLLNGNLLASCEYSGDL